MTDMMVAAAQDKDNEGWYEAFGSGDEGTRLQNGQDAYGEEFEEEEEEEEEFEVEEMLDNEPMHITGRLFLGSIDASTNERALRAARIGGVFTLFANGEDASPDGRVPLKADDGEAEVITRTRIELRDDVEEDLLAKLPAILSALSSLLKEVHNRDENVLVHCVAGRSRSPAVVVAWILAQDPSSQSVQEAVDTVRVMRPWIEINARFVRDLHLFHAILIAGPSALDPTVAATLASRRFPRLDFGPSLVENILLGKKLVTMRLLSDDDDDKNSDLVEIFPHSTVIGTVTHSSSDTERIPERKRFALLRVDRIDTKTLSSIDSATLHKSGFETCEEVLQVLQQFYPHVSMETPLKMLHFQCIHAL